MSWNILNILCHAFPDIKNSVFLRTPLYHKGRESKCQRFWISGYNLRKRVYSSDSGNVCVGDEGVVKSIS